jgi:D-arabinose 1-dehydrogenase-like Zn-dependent alcohol dehydrogenase
MRAAVLSTQSGSVDVEELDVDDLGRNEVVVRVMAAGLCHSDLHFMEQVPHSRALRDGT